MSAAFGEQKSRISSATKACLWGSLVPVTLVCQSKAAEEQVFAFFCDPFMVRLLYQQRGGFQFAAHNTTVPLAPDALRCIAQHYTRQRMEHKPPQRRKKRLWSEPQRRSLTLRPSPFRQLCSPKKTNIGVRFLHTAINILTQPNYLLRKSKKNKKNRSSSFQEVFFSYPILAYSFIACFWFVASSMIALPLTKDEHAALSPCSSPRTPCRVIPLW